MTKLGVVLVGLAPPEPTEYFKTSYITSPSVLEPYNPKLFSAFNNTERGHMNLYIVTRKSDGVEVFRYEHSEPVEFVGFEFVTHDHIAVTPTTQPSRVGRVLTKLAYLRLFTQEERIAIRAAAANSAELADYLELLNIADEVNTSDPDIQSALYMLEAAHLLAAGRADEILRSA